MPSICLLNKLRILPSLIPSEIPSLNPHHASSLARTSGSLLPSQPFPTSKGKTRGGIIRSLWQPSSGRTQSWTACWGPTLILASVLVSSLPWPTLFRVSDVSIVSVPHILHGLASLYLETRVPTLNLSHRTRTLPSVTQPPWCPLIKSLPNAYPRLLISRYITFSAKSLVADRLDSYQTHSPFLLAYT